MPGMTSITRRCRLRWCPTEGKDQGTLGQGMVQAGADEDVGGPERPEAQAERVLTMMPSSSSSIIRLSPSM